MSYLVHMVHICFGIPWCDHDESVKKSPEENMNPYPKWPHPLIQVMDNDLLQYTRIPFILFIDQIIDVKITWKILKIWLCRLHNVVRKSITVIHVYAPVIHVVRTDFESKSLTTPLDRVIFVQKVKDLIMIICFYNHLIATKALYN